MKTGVVFFLAVIVMVVPSVQAEKFEWSGTEVLTSISGEVPFLDGKLPIQSFMSYFRIPGKEVEQFYFYVGPGLVIKKWGEKDSFWLSPRVGVVAGEKMDERKDAFIVSLWTGVSLFEGQLSLFLEGEGYLNRSQEIYYGYYVVDYNPTDSLNIGLHLEQIDKAVSFGPHIGVTNNPWYSEIRYFVGANEENDNFWHSVRFVTGLRF